jgi:hypothetical protein
VSNAIHLNKDACDISVYGFFLRCNLLLVQYSRMIESLPQMYAGLW